MSRIRFLNANAIYGTALFILFFVPAFINGYPILYPDSVGYFHAGYSVLSHLHLVTNHVASLAGDRGNILNVENLDGISTARSVYYGVIYAAAYGLFGEWMLPLLQVAVASTAIILATTRLIPQHWFLVSALLIELCGLGFFGVTIMPDLFTGLLVLSVAMSMAYSKRLTRWESVFWLALAFASCLFHKINVAIVGLIVLTVAPFAWRLRKQEIFAFAGVFVLALFAHLAVSATIEAITGEWPIDPPFVLARMIGDGTAVKYLRQACPTVHYQTCAFLQKMPMTEIQFLWGRADDKSVMGTASREVRQKISAEALQIELGTLKLSPLSQLVQSIENSARQFVTVGVNEYSVSPSDTVAPIASYQSAINSYRRSAIGEHQMPLGQVSFLMRSIYLLSLALISWMLLAKWGSKGSIEDTWFVGVVLLGLILNAVICGAVSGVFDRYQGRVAWLAPLVVIAMFHIYLQRNSPSEQHDFAA